MSEVMIKMPNKKNTFSGRCCMNFEEFEKFKELVGIGKLKLIFHDDVIRTYPVQQWMIDHARFYNAGNEEFMLVTFSKHQYQKDCINDKKFGRTPGEDTYENSN